jgi:flagellar hook-associated protein 1 FlgK
MRELTATASLEATQKVLQNAETALGQFLDRTKDSTSIQNALRSGGGGISDALTDFFNAWESVSVKPGDIGEKQLLIEKAKILAEKINQTDERLEQVQMDVDEQLKVDVDVVNGILDEIAKMNQYIAKAELGKPYSAVDLRDQRQAKLEELSKFLDIQFETIPDSQGQIKVSTGDSTLVDGPEVPGKLAYDDISTSPNYRKFSLGGAPFVPTRGSLAAQSEISQGSVQDARSEIKTLRDTLKDQVNSAYTPEEFFSVSTAGKISLQVSSIQTGTAGSNRIALDVAALGTKAYSALGGGTFTAYFNKTVTTVAQQLSSTNIRLEDQKLSEQNAVNSRDQYSGVSQDEEITDMMKFQRSFQASARHINVLDTLLEQVVNRLGVG